MLRFAAVAIALVITGVASAATPRPKFSESVIIRAGAPKPRNPSIYQFGSIFFINAEFRTHSLRSAAFRPFTLRPGKFKKICFPKKGAFPYTIDGRKAGTIKVTASGGSCARGATGGAAGGSKTFRYGLRVDVRLKYAIEYSGLTGAQALGNGKDTLTLTWTANFDDVRVKVQQNAGSILVNTVVHEPEGRLAPARLEFQDTRPSAAPCTGAITYSPRTMILHLAGSKQANGPTQVDGDVALKPGEDERFDAETAAGQAGCNTGHFPGMAVWLERDPTVNGIEFDPPSSGIDEVDTRWSVDAPGLAFPLDKLRVGAGFTLDTGLRSVPPTSCGGDPHCSESFEGRVTWVYTKR